MSALLLYLLLYLLLLVLLYLLYLLLLLHVRMPTCVRGINITRRCMRLWHEHATGKDPGRPTQTSPLAGDIHSGTQ